MIAGRQEKEPVTYCMLVGTERVQISKGCLFFLLTQSTAHICLLHPIPFSFRQLFKITAQAF